MPTPRHAHRETGSTIIMEPLRLLRMLSLLLATVTLVATISGCASIKDFFGDEEEQVDVYLPAEQLIIKGMDEFNVGNYRPALQYFNEILDRYPFSPEAPLAELKAADANYYLERYAEALVLYREFEERHPTNEAIPYVMYQKAMCNYQQIDTIDRDITGATEAIQAFNELLRAFPNSPYSQEAQARIKAAKEFLVNHEFFVVQFYLRTEKYEAAEARLQYILSTYPESRIAPRATELLEMIKAGSPPAGGIAGWFKGLALPDWMDFLSD
ncbi:outer membrane protein assembly factor BamD [Desulfofustis glycolicus]|uniref:Beta-barrel assembly machine subunit BamD n=1 Tax=Desulfofustis glycolicus DSM 9705 TaxID=1121409 RepID=A0A1M5UXN7_9BACT|nr:outer membrane protein assembly factor BamD [Desulfofustis glycolicus]SHH67700.1 Beta-barrel assembly machine subunit BamD [Desulfofustis glycolicus DSM 9705]